MPDLTAAPIFIVAGPKVDSRPLLDAFAAASGVWHAHPEKSFLDALPSTGRRGWDAHRLTEEDAPALAEAARDALTKQLLDRENRKPADGGGVAIAAGPRLALAVPFLAAAFPAARFVHLRSEPAQEMAEKVVEETLAADLEALDDARTTSVDRATLLDDPREALRRLGEFAAVPYDQAMLSPLEVERRRAAAAAPGPSPYASRFTRSFAAALNAYGGSLLVSTYQANKLVVARVHEGTLNTHFRDFDKPMGMALKGNTLALGTRTEVWDLRDMPEVAPKIEPANTHDACFLPRNRHVTGDIAVHELGFAGDELWLVATAFSCLATLDENHSFVPRWRPPFISALAPGDRCHLNGMEIVDGAPRFVTALGTTDEPGGWRAGKATGGVLMDVPSSEIIVSGLSMPHSPRVYDNRLWVLESGKGELCTVDVAAGTTQTVCELPGFTRGLAFAGRMAFVGLSQIRESSTFGDLPLTHRLEERVSGVWMVDIDSGEAVGFLRFDDLVQEVFDLELVPGKRYPEVAEPGSTAVASSYVLP